MSIVNTPAFIIGNGPSRRGVDLASLEGTTYGCNALYRDFAPDFLVAVDKKMQEEIIASGYHENHICYFRDPQRSPKILQHPNIITWKHHRGAVNNSGIAAVYHAMKHGHRTIVLLGMDLKTERHDANIYADTPNYLNQNNKPPKVRRNIFDTLSDWFIRNHKIIKFVRVIDDKCWNPAVDNQYKVEGFSEPYLTHMTYKEYFK